MEVIKGFALNQSHHPNIELLEGLYIEVPDEVVDDCAHELSLEIYRNKALFSIQGWLITGGVSILSGILAYYISGRSLKPLKLFSEKIEVIEMENLPSSFVEEADIKEFKILAQSFNRMVERLNDSFQHQRHYQSAAAHELKTPLALIQAEIDYAKQEKMTVKEFETLIDNIGEETEHLSILIDSLLELSAAKRLPRQEIIAIAPLIEEVIADLDALAEAKEMTVAQLGEDFNIKGSDPLIYRMVYNIIENAIKYAYVGGDIQVETTAQGIEKTIYIRDNGPGIPKEARERVFESFYRLSGSGAKDAGYGLGLAMVKQIADIHDADVVLTDTDEWSLVVKITFHQDI